MQHGSEMFLSRLAFIVCLRSTQNLNDFTSGPVKVVPKSVMDFKMFLNRCLVVKTLSLSFITDDCITFAFRIH